MEKGLVLTSLVAGIGDRQVDPTGESTREQEEVGVVTMFPVDC